MLSLIAALVASQATCEIVAGCIGPPTNLCAQWVMCGPSTFMPTMGACPSGQFVTSTTDSGVTCAAEAPQTTPTITASTPSRSLNANFQPSATKATWVSYSISISCAMTLGGGQTSTVELRSDTSATPTTVRATAANGNSGTLIVGVAITNAQTLPLSHLVPAGHNVRLVSSGSCTVSLVSQTEVGFD